MFALALLAAGINWAQAMATGVIGAGIAVGIGGATMIRKETQQRQAANQSPMGSAVMLKFIAVLLVALALIIGGIAWRSSVT